MSAETTDYAVCVEEGCGIALPTPEDAEKHGKETMRATGDVTGVTARGHARRILNPTREQQADRAVGYEIERATERAFEALDREIEAGRLTRAEVTKAMRYYPDFADGWAEWNADAEEEDDTAANEADDQNFLPWRDDNPKHRPVWRAESRMWHCTCGQYSADRLRHIREHADIRTAKESAA
jgi:hypothetical protein